MKKVILALVALIALTVAPSFALEADYIPMSFAFPLVTTATAAAAVSVTTFVAAENITVKSLYATETDGITASSTDYVSFNLIDDGTIIQSVKSTAAFTAMTPKAATIVTTGRVNKIAKGSVVTVSSTKVGDGVQTTTPYIQLVYTVGW